jgi:hypothetical protein
VQSFGLKEGVPFTQYWQGLRARRQMVEFLAPKIENAIRQQQVQGQSGAIVSRLISALEGQGVFGSETQPRYVPCTWCSGVFDPDPRHRPTAAVATPGGTL